MYFLPSFFQLNSTFSSIVVEIKRDLSRSNWRRKNGHYRARQDQSHSRLSRRSPRTNFEVATWNDRYQGTRHDSNGNRAALAWHMPVKGKEEEEEEGGGGNRAGISWSRLELSLPAAKAWLKRSLFQFRASSSISRRTLRSTIEPRTSSIDTQTRLIGINNLRQFFQNVCWFNKERRVEWLKVSWSEKGKVNWAIG